MLHFVSFEHQCVFFLKKLLVAVVLTVFGGVFFFQGCKTIPGVDDGQVLVADFSLRCGIGEHRMYRGLAFASMALFVLGIPLAIWMVLKKNRKHLYDTTSPKHQAVLYSLGGLYSQYEEEWWWFEIAIIVHKMFMT